MNKLTGSFKCELAITSTATKSQAIAAKLSTLKASISGLKTICTNPPTPTSITEDLRTQKNPKIVPFLVMVATSLPSKQKISMLKVTLL